MMFRNVFFKTLRDQRYSFLWWSVGLVALSFYVMYIYPYMTKAYNISAFMEKMPPFIKNLIGNTANLSTPEGFLNIQTFSWTVPILFLIIVISKAGDAIAGEKERGTLDMLLANPVSRTRVLSDKFGAIFVLLFLLSVILWIGMTVGSVVFSVSISPVRLFEVIISCFMLSVTFTAMTLTLGCALLRKKMVVGIISTFTVVTLLVNAYTPMINTLKPYRHFNPFYYYNGATPLINGLDLSHFLIQTGFAVFFFFFSIFIFRNKDLI